MASMYFIRNRFGMYLQSINGDSSEWTCYIHDGKGFASRQAAARYMSKFPTRYIISNSIVIVQG